MTKTPILQAYGAALLSKHAAAAQAMRHELLAAGDVAGADVADRIFRALDADAAGLLAAARVAEMKPEAVTLRWTRDFTNADLRDHLGNLWGSRTGAGEGDREHWCAYQHVGVAPMRLIRGDMTGTGAFRSTTEAEAAVEAALVAAVARGECRPFVVDRAGLPTTTSATERKENR